MRASIYIVQTHNQTQFIHAFCIHCNTVLLCSKCTLNRDDHVHYMLNRLLARHISRPLKHKHCH